VNIGIQDRIQLRAIVPDVFTISVVLTVS